MRMVRKSVLSAASAVVVAVCGSAHAQFELKTGDRIAIIGNALADRMQHDGWLETYIHKANPGKQIVVRDMGFAGDQVALRPREEGFPSPDYYLSLIEADVIFAFFGYNESFAHDPETFKNELNAFLDEMAGKKYNGESAPRVVLFSPIAYEDMDSPNLPDGEELNEWLGTYTDAMASVARRRKVPFVDLYYPTQELYDASDAPLTINGVHLNSSGNQAVAKIIVNELFGDTEFDGVDAIRAAVLDKNWCWFNRYRATDGNDIWGSRAPLAFVGGQTNADVLTHELAMLDAMAANRDPVIWAAIAGKRIQPDDSNVPPPVEVITNIEPAPDKRDDSGGHLFVPADEGVKTFTLQDGLEANLFASEDMFEEVVNPVQLDVDTKGRLWVASWQTYPKWQPDLPMLDRLVILPDEDRDGVADKAITFAYVHNPTAFTFWNGGVLVASVPNFWFLKDTDGDDVADVKEIVLSGLDSADTHHSANGFDYGPDGYIYYQRGIFNVSNIETPWEAAQLSGRSAMYRFNPRTYRFSYHAENPPNPHGGDFNYWGYHFATSATGGEAYQVREDGGGKFKMHKLLEKTVRPVPSSGILSSQHLPEKMNGNFIILNSIGFLGIKQYTLENTDGKFWGTETDNLLVSSDSNFRPTDFKVGDDGALYVSDWTNPIIGHMQHNIRDPNRDHEHGRIYRVTTKGRPLQDHVEIDGQPIEALLDVLKHRVDGVRLRARIELSERDTGEVIASVQKWAAQFDPKKREDAHHLLEALWLHQQHNVFNESLLNTVLGSPDPDARRAAERVRYMWDIEGKFATKATAAAPKPDTKEVALAALQEARDYLKQEASPEPRMDGDTFEIHIQTLKEQMRYDRAVFTVPAGMKVRLVFSNPDAMDHNLIMVQPGAASKVAVAAMKMEETGEGVAKQWRPESDAILFATNMLPHGKSQTIEFTAPSVPGDYDYLCTFPGHWQLMRGVMRVVATLDDSIVVVNRLDAPKTVTASTREVVEYWTFDQLKDGVNAALSGRSYETGKRMFEVAGCSQCHRIGVPGDTVGPDLADVGTRYTPATLLEHILDPSLEVKDEYKTFVVETKDGREYIGQILKQTEDTVIVREDPLKPAITATVKRADIKEIDPIAMSPMPTDLLITLQKDEIWDLIAFLLSGDKPTYQAFNGAHSGHRPPSS